MKNLVIAVGCLLVFGGAGFLATGRYWHRYSAPKYRQVAVSLGRITSVVRATGTVEPVLAVQVGSFVSGPIASLSADFNDVVKKGDLLAQIDRRICEAEVASNRA